MHSICREVEDWFPVLYSPFLVKSPIFRSCYLQLSPCYINPPYNGPLTEQLYRKHISKSVIHFCCFPDWKALINRAMPAVIPYGIALDIRTRQRGYGSMGGPYLPEQYPKTHGRHSRRAGKSRGILLGPLAPKMDKTLNFQLLVAHRKLALLFPKIPDLKSLYLVISYDWNEAYPSPPEGSAFARQNSSLSSIH